MDHQPEQKVPFGHAKVSEREKTQRVHDVFSKVATRYDLMNDAMSLFQHRLWKDRFVNQIPLQDGAALLDVSCGSGDIALRLYKKAKKQGVALHQISLVDPNDAMLQLAKDRFTNKGWLAPFSYTQAPAEALPFPKDTFDVYTISFGLRNVTNRPQALAEAQRVLKPGGHFFCLEFSRPRWPGLDTIYNLYSFGVIPKLGRLLAKDEESYQYLVESIQTFPSQNAIKKEIATAGFTHVTHTNLSGGIVAIHHGIKQ